MVIKYMHTINGRPAYYEPGLQICYATLYRPVPLASDLNQIRREQRATARWRRSQGFQVRAHEYRHQRIET